MLQEVSSILYALKGKENREKSSSLFIDLNLQKRKKNEKTDYNKGLQLFGVTKF